MKALNAALRAGFVKRIEAAYLCGEAMELTVLCEDEAGPFQTVPYPS